MAFKVYNDINDAHHYAHTLVHVEIDKENNLIRRTYSNKLPCVSGEINPGNRTEEEIKIFFNRDLFWNRKLQSKFVPELIDYNEDEQWMIQRYYEPSTLNTGKMPTVDEVVELYTFFKLHNVNKLNGSLSNMTYNDKQLIAFDFKYARVRPEYNKLELSGYAKWLIKIDNKLPTILARLLFNV